MTRLLSIILLIALFGSESSTQEVYKRTLILMGTRFDITVVAGTKHKAEKYIELAIGEIKRIEQLAALNLL